MSENTEVLIVDDHPVIGYALELMFRDHLRNVKAEVVHGGKDALAKLKEKCYDLVLLDVNLPDYDILMLIPNMQRIRSDLKILIFTMAPENVLAQRLFSMNVMGFLAKSASRDETLDAIKSVLAGKRYVSDDFMERMMQDFLEGNKVTDPFEKLSDREYQILVELLKGKSQREIGEKLSLHFSSVATYRSRIFEKLNVSNQMELYEKARVYGLTS